MSESTQTNGTTPKTPKRGWIQRQFFALYDDDLPATVVLRGRKYRHVQTFKYDFFAGTGLYVLDDFAEPVPLDLPRRIVAKIYRCRRFFGLPAAWIGKRSVRHESRLYQLLHDIPGVPRFEGLVGPTGFAHEFIPGRPLKRRDFTDDLFFDRLKVLLQTIHDRGVSYIDLHKFANILLGDDRRPYLIDFQISYAPRRHWWASRKMLSHFQKEDWYHYLKHKRRLRKDLLTQEEWEESFQPTLANQLHRRFSKPYFRIRRWVMSRLGLESTE